MTKNPKTVWILGAGFSKPAGMPLAVDLPPLLVNRLGLGEDDENRRWLESLAGRMRWLGYCDNNAGLRINIEQVFHFAHFEAETCRLRQHRCPVGRNSGHTPYQDAVEVEGFLQYLEEALVNEIVEQELHADLEKLSGLAGEATESDSILSFNYDTLAERALQEANKSWHHGTQLDMERCKGIPVYKLHGSVNWIRADRSENFSKCDLLFDKENENRRSSDPPTGHVEDDCRLWRCRTLDQTKTWVGGRGVQIVADGAWPLRPGIAGLGAYKELHAIPGLGEIWIRAMQTMYQADRAIVIGFQMSDFDAMAQLQFAASMMKRHEESRPLKVTVIDPGAANQDFIQRFLRVFRDVRFIPERHEKFDWSRLE